MKWLYLLLCLGYVSGLPDERRGTCTPLESWKIDCNLCFCPVSGLYNRAGCTVLECTTTKKCSTPGSWKEGCNECYCSKNGVAICSNKKC